MQHTHATATGDAAHSRPTLHDARERADRWNAPLQRVQQPREERARLRQVDRAPHSAEQGKLQRGHMVLENAVLADHRVEHGEHELVAELADERDHDQVVHLQLAARYS